jgi:chromosome segregation ATPase
LDGIPITLPEDRIKHLESQTQALEMQLAYRSEDTANTVAECDAIREELADATQKYESERKMSIDVARSMTRQYKGMQEDLLNKINDRERCIEALKDELETLKAAHKKQIADKDDVIQQKDANAAKKRVEVENLCRHFANLIAEARLRIVTFTQDKELGSVKTAA